MLFLCHHDEQKLTLNLLLLLSFLQCNVSETCSLIEWQLLSFETQTYSSHLMLLFILFCDMYQTGSNPVVDRGTWLAVTKSFLPVTRYILGGTDEPYKFFHIDWLSAITDPFFLRWSATFTKTSLFPCKGKICVS